MTKRYQRAEKVRDGANMSEMNKGLTQIVAGYLIWGVSPVYWKALDTVAPADVIALRSVGTLLVLVGVHALWRSWPSLLAVAADRRNLLVGVVCALLVSINWGLYIWAVHNDRVTEAALGYFINPLVSVALGVGFLHERLHRLQMVSVSCAAVGVAYLTLRLDGVPWIPLILAFSFASYGLIRKVVSYGAVDGLTLESAFLLVPGVIFLTYRFFEGAAPMGDGSFGTTALVLLAGPLTAVPLLLFASGSRLVPLNVVGVAQFLVPTTQFLLGVFVYDEAFGVHHGIGYVFIWTGVALFGLDIWRTSAGARVNRIPGPATTGGVTIGRRQR